ncbi:hypothetical protein ACRDU6_08190 [Mycolicibacterium sp. ELW1]|uniref:hypothetical protein n=1 Tax=Mycobacteriaceae TaxID=1762 RepID=UPI0011EC6436|nr:hypothetical protein [Mycobacterium sp. ELW1]QEN12663.1 hypothetical protein D3H54_04740 [Mycobacterium sp. ELW1]
MENASDLADLWGDVTGVGAGTWLAVAAWAAVLLGLAALIYAHRQIRRQQRVNDKQARPHVAMFMEPHSADWHVIELVVRNYGATAAYDVGFAFPKPPTVARYEHAEDGFTDIVELALPQSIPELAPAQEWRTVWDSALDRSQFGESIDSRFEGVVSYHDQPEPQGWWAKTFGRKRTVYRTKVALDWDTLQPVHRVEMMTGHDLARREREKLELLRNVLDYFHFATKETRVDVLREEIARMKRAAEETQSRWRRERFEQPTEVVRLPRHG